MLNFLKVQMQQNKAYDRNVTFISIILKSLLVDLYYIYNIYSS